MHHRVSGYALCPIYIRPSLVSRILIVNYIVLFMTVVDVYSQCVDVLSMRGRVVNACGPIVVRSFELLKLYYLRCKAAPGRAHGY